VSTWEAEVVVPAGVTAIQARASWEAAP